jgi:hypothetical protein
MAISALCTLSFLSIISKFEVFFLLVDGDGD